MRRGASAVTLIARNRDKLESAVEKLLTTASPYESRRSDSDDATCTVRAFSCDVTNADAVAQVFKVLGEPDEGQVAKAAGLVVATTTTSGLSIGKNIRPVDVLVNCAGICICDNFDSILPEELDHQLRTNVCGTLYPSREVSEST